MLVGLEALSGSVIRETAEFAEGQILSAVRRESEVRPSGFRRCRDSGNVAPVSSFKAEYKSRMELYLRWLAKHEQEPDEAPPIGIILCAGKKQEQIELLELGKSGIHVAEYLTVLPPRETLQAKLHQSIAAARARLDDKRESP